MKQGVDYYTKQGAKALALMIEAYWHSCFFKGIKAKPYKLPIGIDLYGVKSNIGPTGFPPREKGTEA